MELVAYDSCRVIYLMSTFRPEGGPFLPEIVAKVIARYNFARYPGLDDLGKDTTTFQMGKFQDAQINEFNVYGDGILAGGKCSTEVLEGFLNDIVTWGRAEIGFRPILGHRDEIHFESNIVVQSKVDLASVINSDLTRRIAGELSKKVGIEYAPSGFVLDCNTSDVKGRRKPYRFFIERRFGFPFAENLFLCQAPIRTLAHIDLLHAIEQAATK